MSGFSRGRNKHQRAQGLFRERELIWAATIGNPSVIKSTELLSEGVRLGNVLGLQVHGITNNLPHASRKGLERAYSEARQQADIAEMSGQLGNLSLRYMLEEPAPETLEMPSTLTVEQSSESLRNVR